MEKVQNQMKHERAGAERHESRRSMCKTRGITVDQMQNEMNHDGEGAERHESRRNMCKTKGIIMSQVQNEGNHDETNTYIMIFYVEQNVAVARIIQWMRFLCCIF